MSKKSAQRSKREVIKVIGQAPGLRPEAERIAFMSKVEHYLLADIILTKALHRSLLTRSEYRALEKKNAEHSGLPANSLFRRFFEG